MSKYFLFSFISSKSAKSIPIKFTQLLLKNLKEYLCERKITTKVSIDDVIA